jgi:hypothetical protein
MWACAWARGLPDQNVISWLLQSLPDGERQYLFFGMQPSVLNMPVAQLGSLCL